MSPSLPVIVTLGVFAVAMVTGAPVASSQEEMVQESAQPDQVVDRAKRADEKIFENEQNRPRTAVAKKSDLGALLTPSEPEGEIDEGSEVIVHQEKPVEEDMKERLEAAQKESLEAQQFPQELEQSMHSIVTSVLNDELDRQGADLAAEAQEDSSDTATEEEVEEGSDDDQAVADAAEETAQSDEAQEEIETVETPEGNIVQEQDEEETEDADDEEQEEEEEKEEGTEESEVPAEGGDDEEKDLLEMSSDRLSSEASDEEENDPSEMDPATPEMGGQVRYGYESGYNDPTELFNDYLKMYQYYPRGPINTRGPVDPYFLARRRRSAIASLAKSRRARRIKRDLLDDLYENPNVAYPSLSVDNAVLANQEDYVPLTDDEASVLYGRLLDYLEEVLAEEEAEEEAREEEELPSYEPEFFPEESDFEDQSYLADSYGPEIGSPYEDGYPYGPVDLDTYNKYSKRSRLSYYPSEEKRYFFPFSDEPETHWGAFVPEKRDYRDSITRLQRLAMALDDNPGPYYREIVDEYRKK